MNKKARANIPAFTNHDIHFFVVLVKVLRRAIKVIVQCYKKGQAKCPPFSIYVHNGSNYYFGITLKECSKTTEPYNKISELLFT